MTDYEKCIFDLYKQYLKTMPGQSGIQSLKLAKERVADFWRSIEPKED
jgi:hypothetical protein